MQSIKERKKVEDKDRKKIPTCSAVSIAGHVFRVPINVYPYISLPQSLLV